MELLGEAGDELPRVEVPVGLGVGGLDPFLQRLAQLERVGGGSAANDEAPKAIRIRGRGEEQGRGADVRSDGVWTIEPQRVDEADHELGDSSSSRRSE
jgi:hypothetical protein